MAKLEPKKVKYRACFRGRLKGKAQRGQKLEFGEYGLKAVTRGLVSAAQIESARQTIRRAARRGGKLWIRVFPDKPITKKPPEVRMGAGKGPLSHWSARVLPGRILFELTGVDEEVALRALGLARYKLSVRTKIVRAKRSPA